MSAQARCLCATLPSTWMAGGVATSNWRRPDSFMGEDLQFRPDFRDVTQQWHRAPCWHRHHARRAWLLPGICAAGDGRIAPWGWAVTKVSLDQLEQSWSTVEAPVIVTDENGVVNLGSVPDWKFTALRPLDENTRRRLTNPCSTTAVPSRPWASGAGAIWTQGRARGGCVWRAQGTRDGIGVFRSLAGPDPRRAPCRARRGHSPCSRTWRGPTRRPRVMP